MNNSHKIVGLMGEIAHAAVNKIQLSDWGHVAKYDPKSHCVQVIIPSNQSDDGTMHQTGWIPLGSPYAGNGAGFQAAPMAGATQTNPGAGELCLLLKIGRHEGSMICGMLMHNTPMQPPDNALKPGESVWKHSTGTLIKQLTNGDLQVNANRDLNITTTRDANVTAARAATVVTTTGDISATATAGNVNVTATVGNASVTAGGNASITATLVTVTAGIIDLIATVVAAGLASFQGVMLANFLLIYNAHTHTDPQGGVTGVPNILGVPGGCTSVNFECS